MQTVRTRACLARGKSKGPTVCIPEMLSSILLAELQVSIYLGPSQLFSKFQALTLAVSGSLGSKSLTTLSPVLSETRPAF